MTHGDKRIIINYLKSLRETGDGWILAGKVRSIQTPFGWIGFRGDRNIRDLVKSGILEKRMNGKYAEVRYIVPKPLTPEEKEKEREQMVMIAMGG